MNDTLPVTSRPFGHSTIFQATNLALDLFPSLDESHSISRPVPVVTTKQAIKSHSTNNNTKHVRNEGQTSTNETGVLLTRGHDRRLVQAVMVPSTTTKAVRQRNGSHATSDSATDATQASPDTLPKTRPDSCWFPGHERHTA